jgi:hypothetical protein
MSNERREQGHKSHAEKMARMLGKADKHADKDVKEHEKRKPHLKPAQVARIADHEIEMKGTPKKKRLDRSARKKGGRSGKGDVNIIIAQKPDQPAMGMPPGAMGARPPMVPPPRPPMAPPPQGAMPPAGPPGGMPPAGVMPGGAAGIPPQMPRKKGGRADHPDTDYHYGAGGGLARLEKAARVGARK